jgi:glycosyltransferase involved in cell wall biosynthesis
MSTTAGKLVYILPEFRDQIGSHFYHKYELVRKLQNEMEIFLILERGVRPSDIKHCYKQKLRWFPLRVVELFIVLLFLRMRGYKTFWTHYSFFGGVLAPFFGKSFYWNCGMPWLYQRSIVKDIFFRLAMRRSMLVTGTKGLKALYMKQYELDDEHVVVLPNWINLDRYSKPIDKKKTRVKMNLPEDKKIVLFLHRLSKRKGADRIAHVAQKFGADVIFLVVGSGPLEESIKGQNIMLIGEISQFEVPNYLALCDMLFMPSEEEGFPHVLLEAMAMGVPFVATDVGGIREIIPDYMSKYVIEGGTIDKYVNVIKDLLSRDTNGISTLLKEYVKKYDIAQIAVQFRKLLVQK